jgi:hypothetical protein
VKLLTSIVFMAAALSAQDLGPGSYKGTWNGSATGDFHLTIRPGGKSAEIGFTIEGQEVPCKVTSLKIEGGSIEMVYQFDLQGNALQSAIKGMLKGKTLEGTYKTTAPGSDDPVDTGTWKTTAQ